MDIIEIKTKESLNHFLEKQPSSQFLQAWQWGEFHIKLGSKVWRLIVKEGDKILAGASLIKKDLPMGNNYFYCPRGPIVKEDISKIKKDLALELLFNEIKKIAKVEGVMFMRFEPKEEIKESAHLRQACLPTRQGSGGQEFQIIKTLDIQPSQTIVLDLEKEEDELLQSMHQKTRYNIRLAEKKGVKIAQVKLELDNFDNFWGLMSETKDRDSFRLHGIDYYREMLDIDTDFIKLFFAKYENRNIATAIVSFFGDTATYMHGASSNNDRNVMAPYLLQWEIAKQAKANGLKQYDFFGIDEVRWPGVTRFKRGFSEKEINYPGTFDLVFNSGWYSVYKMIRKVRRTF